MRKANGVIIEGLYARPVVATADDMKKIDQFQNLYPEQWKKGWDLAHDAIVQVVSRGYHLDDVIVEVSVSAGEDDDPVLNLRAQPRPDIPTSIPYNRYKRTDWFWN